MMRKPTIIDVAEHAGVSWKTVSRVINNEPNVREKTALKVRDAIAKLDFRPNMAARSLAGTRSYLIGVIAANPSPHYMAAIHRGASRACRDHGYLLAIEEVDLLSKDCIADLERGLQVVRVDGVLLCPPASDHEAILELLDRLAIRYVRIDPMLRPERSASLHGADDVGVAALTRHLWAEGYRRFGIVEGPARHRATSVRRDAFIRSLVECGADPSTIITARGDFSFDSGRLAGQRLLSGVRRPEAIFASNDEMAAGVIAAAGELGINVPDDVAVAGFDDSEIASFIWPSLTTVRQHIEGYARTGIALLTSRHDEGAPFPRVRMPVELVVRTSTRSSKKND